MDDSKPQEPNLDLIDMVQQARMKHDSEAKPSNVPAVYWIEARDHTGTANAPTSRAGQWALETTVDEVDGLWETIKSATENGKLGYKARVSTASRNQQAGGTRTILVCTYNRDDLEDLNRVRSALRDLEIEGNWHYQTES